PDPAGRGDGEHDDHTGGEELDVRAAPEAGYVGGALEQRSEQEQPDDGLHERDADPGRLAEERPDVAESDLPGVPQGDHAATSFASASASASRNERPACLRYTSSSEGRAMVADATRRPSCSSAVISEGIAAAP